MPFANEHSARLKSPTIEHIRVRRTSGSGQGTVQGVKIPTSIDIIWFIIKSEGKEVPIAQALRFPVKNWSESSAKKWLKDKKIKFLSFEPAKEKSIDNIDRKIFEIDDLEIKKQDKDDEDFFNSCKLLNINIKASGDNYYISGYANTKNKEDRYGDIPMGDNVYDLKLFKKNPILLIDHNNSASSIAGIFTKIKEDANGLLFKARLMDIEDAHNPHVKHAISAYINGFGRALSIGGRWYYENPDNPKHLTKAVIHEISLVGVGADGLALTDAPKPKNQELEIFEDESEKIKELEQKHGKIRVTKILNLISKERQIK